MSKTNGSPPSLNLTERTSEGLRDTLFQTLDELRDGSIDNQKAIAVARLAAQIIASVQAEIEFHKNVRRGAKDDHSPKTVLRLGHEITAR